MIKDGKNYEYLDIRYVVAITNDTEDPSARWEYIYLNPGITEEEGIKAAKEEWERRKEGNVICVDLHRAVIETDENGFIDIFDIMSIDRNITIGRGTAGKLIFADFIATLLGADIGI